MLCQHGAQAVSMERAFMVKQSVHGKTLRAALLIVSLPAACGLSPPRFGSRAWERRGVYAGRSDMPRVADVASAVGAPAPWQVCACSTLCLEGCL